MGLSSLWDRPFNSMVQHNHYWILTDSKLWSIDYILTLWGVHCYYCPKAPSAEQNLKCYNKEKALLRLKRCYRHLRVLRELKKRRQCSANYPDKIGPCCWKWVSVSLTVSCSFNNLLSNTDMIWPLFDLSYSKMNRHPEPQWHFTPHDAMLSSHQSSVQQDTITALVRKHTAPNHALRGRETNSQSNVNTPVFYCWIFKNLQICFIKQ